MGEPSTDSLHDPYEDQLSAARFKAERDAAVQELQAMRERNIELWMESGMANELATCAEQKAERLGKLVWRLQNRLARAHRRERNLRKGMREWREKAIGGPVHTVSAYDLLSEGEREVLRMWPRFEDGEPVRFGDRVKYRRGTCAVESVRFYMGGGVTVYGNDNDERVVVTEPLFHDPVERADAQVFAADGEPLEVGQTVYGTRDLEPVEIVSLRSKEYDGAHTVKCKDRTGFVFYAPDDLIHQRPVLDADGVPIKKGDTVWHIKTGREYVVVEPSYGETVVVRLAKYDDAEGEQYAPDQLTHTKPEPDSWSSVWADVSNGNETPEGMMRRCRALARRGE